MKKKHTNHLTFNTDRIGINQPLHVADALTIEIANKLTMRPCLEGEINIFDIRNLHPVVDNPMIRFRVGILGGESIVCEMTNNAVAVARNLIVGTSYELRSNTIDTNGDATLNIQQNNNTFISLQSSTVNRVQFSRPIRVIDSGGSHQADFIESTNNSFIEFRLGQHKNSYATGGANNTLFLNYFSKGDVN